MSFSTIRRTALGLACATALTALTGSDLISTDARAQGTVEPQVVSAEAESRVILRRRDDLTAMQSYRPGYTFWQHIFIIPDGSIAFGSAVDGRLLASFPAKGDWVRDANWADPALADLLTGRVLSSKLDERRDQVAQLLEPVTGPVLHNPTRGNFLLPNARRYGSFLAEWGAIYERFGVPADIGLAQVILESGLNGTRRSEANAIGFCQWLRSNWNRLNRLAPVEIEGHNQTTQAPYCAAYLTILATKYGSFIPALSEHNAGGTNVGRTLINGERLGAADIRTRYLLGSRFQRELRALDLDAYRDVFRTYGPRSYLYAEMVFGNTVNVRNLTASTPQVPIHAMRTPRAITLAEITKRTGLSADEVRRFNPALLKRVPAKATLYLPSYIKEYGTDVAFWHRPPSPAYARALDEFVRIEASPEEWDDPAFEPVLRGFQRRFQDTRTEEGTIMATVLAYAMQDAFSSGRRELLAEYRTSDDVLRLFERGVQALDTLRANQASNATQ